MQKKIAMKVTAVLVFVVVIILAIPLCCEGGKWDRENAAKGLSPYSDTSQQQPLSEKSLEVIETSRKWLEQVISDSNIHKRVKKILLELHEKEPSRTRAKRQLGVLAITTCLTEAGLSAIDKACDDYASKWTCHIAVSALRIVMKIVGIADGSAMLQLICDHLGELAYDAGQFLRQLVCQWAKTAFDDNAFIVKHIC